MQFTGIGSMLAVHMQRGPVLSPADAARGNMPAKELFFFDMLKAGYWIARRGMMALCLPLEAADYDGYAAAVEEFVVSRRSLLV